MRDEGTLSDESKAENKPRPSEERENEEKSGVHGGCCGGLPWYLWLGIIGLLAFFWLFRR